MTVAPKDMLPIVSWSTIANNVIKTGNWTYLVTVHPINISDPGASTAEKAIGDYLVANTGRLYSITNILGEVITVNDDFQTGLPPWQGFSAIVFRSICNGSSQWIPPIRYEVLDRSAKSYLETIANEILYRNKGDIGTLTGLSSFSVSHDFKNYYTEIPEGRSNLKVFRQNQDIGSGILKDTDVLFDNLIVTVSGFTLAIDSSEDLTGVQIYFNFNRKL